MSRFSYTMTSQDLQILAEKHGTDKASHGYMRHYHRHLLAQNTYDILEIGCEKGNSIRMWLEALPNVSVVGLDLFMEYPVPDILGATFIKGNQLDHEILYNLRNNCQFDMIIDDGSHNSRDQLVTFYSLFGTSNLYVVEDLHCCNDESYRQGLPFEFTMLGLMKSGNFPFNHFLYDDKIAFIYRETNKWL